MKKCTNCGAVQSNKRNVCIDCGERLGSPISYEEEQMAESVLSEKVEKMAPETDMFFVSLADRIVGVTAIVLTVTLIIMMNVAAGQLKELRRGNTSEQYSISDYGSISEYVHESTARERALDLAGGMAFGGILPSAFSAYMLLFPRVGWTLDTWGYKRWIKFNAEIEPTDTYRNAHRLCGYVLFTIGCIIFAAVIKHMV